MDDLKSLTEKELTARNVSLIQQRDAIREAQRAITRELDRRDDLKRQAKQLAALPDELRAGALAGADPELSELVTELVVSSAVPTQTIAPQGVASSEAVGQPGGDDDDDWTPQDRSPRPGWRRRRA